MPEKGVRYLPKKDLLTFDEILRLVNILAPLGISKIRLTGGEPFVRSDLMRLIRNLVQIPGIADLHLTTNGVLTLPYIAELKKLNIASVNLSLDALNRERFLAITHRDEFETVMKTLHALLDAQIPVKINAVVMDGKNIDDILPLVELTRQYPVDVRFIEEMPFNGKGQYQALDWTHRRIWEYIQTNYPAMKKAIDPDFSTSYNYQIPGHAGKVGIIAAFTRTFCGTCNRIRVTAQGTLKTCLYDEGVLDIRKLLRETNDDEIVKQHLMYAFQNRVKDGFEAEAMRKTSAVTESMSAIGG
jgi:cyclic pyranopterin phosphate synthase